MKQGKHEKVAPGYRRHPGQSYRKDHCHRIGDIIYDGMDLSFLTGEGNVARRHKCRSKWNLAKQICQRFMEMVIDDLVDNGNVWKLPIQQGCHMRIVRKADPAIQSIARRGRYYAVDLFESDFNIYEVVLDFQHRGRLTRRTVQIDYGTWRRMAELVNNGKRYQEGFYT